MYGELTALVTAFLWAWTATFFTRASHHVGSFTVNFYRIPMGLLLLSLTYLLMRGGFAFTAYQAGMLGLSGVIGLAIGDAFLFESFVLVGPRITMLIYTTSPAMTAIIAFFYLGERIGSLAIAGMVIIMTGVTWVLTEKKNGQRHFHLRGIIYALLGSLGQSIGLVFAKAALVTDIDPLYATMIRMSAAFIAMLVVVTFYRRPGSIMILKENRRALLPLLGGVICGPYLGVWLSQVAIKLTATGIAATLMATVPIIIIPISILVEKEKVSTRAILGAGVAIIGVALLFVR